MPECVDVERKKAKENRHSSWMEPAFNRDRGAIPVERRRDPTWIAVRFKLNDGGLKGLKRPLESEKNIICRLLDIYQLVLRIAYLRTRPHSFQKNRFSAGVEKKKYWRLLQNNSKAWRSKMCLTPLVVLRDSWQACSSRSLVIVRTLRWLFLTVWTSPLSPWLSWPAKAWWALRWARRRW